MLGLLVVADRLGTVVGVIQQCVTHGERRVDGEPRCDHAEHPDECLAQMPFGAGGSGQQIAHPGDADQAGGQHDGVRQPRVAVLMPLVHVVDGLPFIGNRIDQVPDQVDGGRRDPSPPRARNALLAASSPADTAARTPKVRATLIRRHPPETNDWGEGRNTGLMKTQICDQFGIEFPSSPSVIVATVVAAVTNAERVRRARRRRLPAGPARAGAVPDRPTTSAASPTVSAAKFEGKGENLSRKLAERIPAPCNSVSSSSVCRSRIASKGKLANQHKKAMRLCSSVR